jgi:hypothetical protein
MALPRAAVVTSGTYAARRLGGFITLMDAAVIAAVELVIHAGSLMPARESR